MDDFTVDLREQSGVKRVLFVGTLDRPRAPLDNGFSGNVDPWQCQARRALDVAP